ncbi:MAG: transcription antitermination factor NusB [Pseudomonadota bacterium]
MTTAGMTTAGLAQQSDEMEAVGLPARRLAADLIEAVIFRKQSLDAQHQLIEQADLAREDRAFAMALTLAALRHYGALVALADSRLERPLPQRAKRVEMIFVLGLAQLLILKTPPHAAVAMSVELAKDDGATFPFAALVNAVLRRLSEIEGLKPDTEKVLPAWLMQRWEKTYGKEIALAMVRAQLQEPPLDLTPKENPQEWVEKLGATLLPTGTIRLANPKGGITALPGFVEGAWWVQDAGALLPILALGDVENKNVLDLCAAPGGKTAALRSRGANVTALDRSQTRLDLLRDNLERLTLEAEVICADATKWETKEKYDAILLDAPCSSTGTLRRHPDVAWAKSEKDILKLANLQGTLLRRAVSWLKPGGTLVYSTCSLEPEEGEQQIAHLLAENAALKIQPLDAADIGGFQEALTPDGTIRVRPDMLAESGGIDGFYCARLINTAT